MLTTDYLASVGRRHWKSPTTRTTSGLTLHRDNKTGALSKWKYASKGGNWENMIPNALPLPAGPVELGGSCPGATDACRNCYAVHGLEFRDAFAAIVTENLAVLERAHQNGNVVEVLLEAIDLSASLAAEYGVAPTFRFHSDGDIFTGWYARAIRRAAEARPNVEMWIYTRSFVPGANHLWSLVGRQVPANLHVFVSVDRHNVDHAARVLDTYRAAGVRAAILAEDDAEQATIEARLGERSIVCPATAKYAHDGLGSSYVVGLDGRRGNVRSAEVVQGACAACTYCLRPGKDVTFLLHGGNKSAETAVKILLKRTA